MGVDLARYPFDARVIHKGATPLESVVALTSRSSTFDIQRYISRHTEEFRDLVYSHLAVVFEVNKPVIPHRASNTLSWQKVFDRPWGGGSSLHVDATCQPSLLTPESNSRTQPIDMPWRVQRPPTLVARAEDVKDSVRRVITHDPSLYDQASSSNLAIREILENKNDHYRTSFWPESYGATLSSGIDHTFESVVIADLLQRAKVYQHQWAQQQGYTVLALPNKTMGMAEGPKGTFSHRVLPCTSVHGRPDSIRPHASPDPRGLMRAFISEKNLR